jgi:hypothetical protein
MNTAEKLNTEDFKDNKVVLGILKLKADVERAVELLKIQGFRNQDISVLLPQDQNSKDFTYEKSTKASEGTTVGATSGAVLGGGLGWLVGAGAIALPGIGPFIAAGPIMALLAGLGIGGTVGGVTGALIGMEVPEYEAKRYEDYLKKGGILLSVHVDNEEWSKKAKDLLNEVEAIDVSCVSESHLHHKKVEGIGTMHL